MASLYILLSPWFLILIAVINLPILLIAFDKIRLNLPTRRNHALEHATILILRGSGYQRIGGQARPNGFRISGAPSEKEIRKAFETVRQQLAENKPLNYLSAGCGSNRIMALTFGLVLLFSVVIMSLIFRPHLILRAIGLAITVVAFMVMRHPVGNWFQERLFMATDFKKVTLREIRKVKTKVWEQSTTYFVETNIS